MSHWMSWQLGFSPSHSRELVRQANALQDLPQTRAAFERGELCESAVCQITRGGTAANEEILLNVARRGAGWHLANLCRLYRRALAVNDPETAKRLVSHYLKYRYDDDGSMRGSFRLPADQGQILRRSLQLTKEKLRDAGEQTERVLYDDYEQREAVALVAMAESALANELASRPGSDRFKILVHVGAGAPAETERGTLVPDEILRRLLCDCDVEVVHDEAEKADAADQTGSAPNFEPIPARARRIVRARDRWCCFPCERQRRLHRHPSHQAQGQGRRQLAGEPGQAYARPTTPRFTPWASASSRHRRER
jgi:hypothetical protein